MLITKDFFSSSSYEVAPLLLGKVLCRQLPCGEIKKGIIVETEAYTQTDDPACHAYKGKTIRNSSLFLEGGHSYVYLIYGMYHCLNTVTGNKGDGQGVLIRALEMIEPKVLNYKSALHPASGPGKLCRYLAINKLQDGILFSPENGLWLEENEIRRPFTVSCSTRVGISVAKEKQWRFFIEGNPAVSRGK